MDERWLCENRSSYELFPPSFYMTHTPEEAEHITQQTAERIRKLVEELE
jgi:hypothetical protein